MNGSHRPGIPLRIRFRIWSRRILPFFGWALALTILLNLIRGQMVPGQFIGIAEETTVPVSSLVAGRLQSVPVTTHQVVAAGEVIATLDDSASRLEMEAALLDIQTLSAEVKATEARLQQDDVDRELDQRTLRRRLELDVLDARVGEIAELGRRERDAAALIGLDAELLRVSELAEDWVSRRRLDNISARQKALTARLLARDQTVAAFQTAEEAASRRLRELPPLSNTDTDPLIAPLNAAIVAAEKRIDLARRLNEERVLRAPISGQIVRVLQRPGEAVGVDEPIALITATSTTKVTAWVHEDQLQRIEVGGEVRMRTASQPKTLIAGSIANRGPSVQAVPEHALNDPALAEFGIPVTIYASRDHALVPGERVSIRLAR